MFVRESPRTPSSLDAHGSRSWRCGWSLSPLTTTTPSPAPPFPHQAPPNPPIFTPIHSIPFHHAPRYPPRHPGLSRTSPPKSSPPNNRQGPNCAQVQISVIPGKLRPQKPHTPRIKAFPKEIHRIQISITPRYPPLCPGKIPSLPRTPRYVQSGKVAFYEKVLRPLLFKVGKSPNFPGICTI